MEEGKEGEEGEKVKKENKAARLLPEAARLSKDRRPKNHLQFSIVPRRCRLAEPAPSCRAYSVRRTDHLFLNAHSMHWIGLRF